MNRTNNTSTREENRLMRGQIGLLSIVGFSVCLLPRMRKLYRLEPPDRHSTVHIRPSLRRKSIRCILSRKGT